MAEILERLMAKSVRDGDCLRWTGSLSTAGYGQLSFGGRRHYAVHRLAYELLVGPIPEGLELDHVRARGCRFTDCFEVAHLEPVTHQVNIDRREAARTHFRCGHPTTPENTKTHMSRGYKRRRCRVCFNDHRRATRAESRAVAANRRSGT